MKEYDLQQAHIEQNPNSSKNSQWPNIGDQNSFLPPATITTPD